MSGNSADRRKFRRTVNKILGLVVEPTPKPTLFENLISWPVVAAVVPVLAGIGVSQMLAPIYVPDIFFGAAALLVLVKFFTWPDFLSSSKGKVRPASIVLFATLVIIGPLIYWNHKDAPFSFPWLATLDSADGASLLLEIRDYPPEDVDSVVYASTQPLYTLRLSVMQFDPQSGYENEIKKIRDDWSSADAHIPICSVILKDNTTTIIEFYGMSKDAQWTGYLLLRRDKGRVERRAGILGHVSLPRKKEKIEMTEETIYDAQGRLSKKRFDRYRMTSEEMKAWGVFANAKLLSLGE